MTYYETPGVLSDVANYMAMYYNTEVFDKVYSKFPNPQENYRFFNQMKKDVGDLPAELHPFAYTSDKTYCIINNIIFNEPFETISLEGFLDYLRSDKFKLKTYNHWFSINNDFQAVEELQNLDLLGLISNLDVSERIKYLLALFFQDFEGYRDELVELVQKLYQYVLVLRSSYKELLDKSKSDYNNVFFYQYFQSKYNVDISNFAFTLALMNSIHYYFHPSRKFCVVGVYNNKVFRPKPNVGSFSYIFQDSAREKIVEYLSRFSYVKQNELLEYMQMQHHAVYQHINFLVNEGVMNRKYYGKECHLSLNEDYFKNLPGIYNQAFAKLTGAKKDEA